MTVWWPGKSRLHSLQLLLLLGLQVLPGGRCPKDSSAPRHRHVRVSGGIGRGQLRAQTMKSTRLGSAPTFIPQLCGPGLVTKPLCALVS